LSAAAPVIRRRALALLGSATVHVCALAALLALAATLREAQPLFVDLTAGAPAGDPRPVGAPTRGREAASASARQATRTSARIPPASAPAAPPRPADATSAPEPLFSASSEEPTADRGGPPSVTDAEGRESKGVQSDGPGSAGQPSGIVGGGGSMLALASPSAGRGEAAGEFGPYLARFRERIQESVVYPLAARRRGLAGRVEVELLLDPSGRVRDLAVVSSSSHIILDEAAVEAVRSLSPIPLPEYLPRRPLRVRLPIVFQLQ
jgi:periplasmic protein TonB